MSLLADDLSLILEKQSKPACSKIAIPTVVVLLENKQNNLKKTVMHGIYYCDLLGLFAINCD
jgi:hypothetical protein